MNIEKRILTQNPCYQASKTITPKGIMVHSLGVAQPDPEVFARRWNQPPNGVIFLLKER